MIQYLIRPAQQKDLDGFLKLSQSFPLYNLPNHRKILKEKLELSEQAFQKKREPFNRNYVFALEDLKNKKVIGSSQILSFSNKSYAYCYLLEKKQDSHWLKLISVKEKRHQLGGLVLSKKHRASKKQFGLQLSLSRFLYIKNKAKEFSKTLEVSLTSPFQKKDNPFWLETGAKYLKQDYLQALKLYRNDPDSFLKKFPKELKIDLQSLSEKAKLCLETVHPQTLPAYKGLLKRGFQASKRYHLLDGGLYLESQQAHLFKKIDKPTLKFVNFEKIKEASFFLIAKIEANPFLAIRIKGRKKENLLEIEKNSVFKEGEKVLSLPL